MKRPSGKIREFLTGGTESWARMKRRVRALKDAELREAEELELLGARRVNILKILRSERFRRAGKFRKMSTLKVETNL